jgi:D-aminopeptidase
MAPSRFFSALALLALTLSAGAEDGPRGRARDFGVVPGVFTPGPLNALTDVAGVKVGHKTLIEGDRHPHRRHRHYPGLR